MADSTDEFNRVSGQPRRPAVRQDKAGAANRLVDVRALRSHRRPKIAQFKRMEKRRFTGVLAQGLYEQSTRWERWKCSGMRGVRVTLENFSLLNNAEGSIQKLVEITNTVKNSKSYFIDFKDLFCKDIGAYLLFAMLYKSIGNGRGRGGDIAPAVNKVLRELGIDKYAKMALPKENSHGVHPLPLEIHTARKDDKNLGATATREDIIAQKVVRAIDSWISQCFFRFKEEGASSLMTGLSEIFENGRHATEQTLFGKRYGTWAVTGFMAQRLPEEEDTGEIHHWCHLAIATTGLTIAESMEQTTDVSMKKDVEGYVDRHLRSSSLSREALLTVAAVQDGVSSDRTEDNPGGCGLGKIVSIVRLLGGQQEGRQAPILSIVSGSTCLSFRAPYNIMVGESGESSQFFNENNDKSVAPDTRFVRDMSVKLPGTVISLRFLIDHEFLNQRLEEHKNSISD